MSTPYRFYDPAPVFMDMLGLQPAASGSLSFFDKGTSTPRMTWSDQALTIPNTNPVQLDSSGRSNTNIWLDGAYTVVLKDAAGATINTRDVDSGVGAGLAIPPLAGQSGKWLTNNGTLPLWATFFMLPDPTGSDGFGVTASGGAYILTPPPAAPSLPVVTDNSIQIGNIKDQWGNASVPATGGAAISSVVITFPTPYVAVPNCTAMVNRSSGVVPAGFIGCLGYSATTTQLTVFFDLNITQTGSQYNLVSAVPITWRAVGKVAT